MSNHYKSRDDIELVVRGFESCTTGKDEFTHQDHLTVAVWYLHSFELRDAIDQMRMSLFCFLDHHGVGREVYNETITVFWMRLIQEFLSDTDRRQSLVEAANTVLEQFSNSRLIFEYYTQDLVRSPMAKKSWVEPDLKPLPS